MKCVDITCDSPAQNLALDEWLLQRAEATNGDAVLRFWEAESDYVVLGRGNKPEREVELGFCEENNIPIYRRCSGGGTVLQTPGVLNYSLILPVAMHPELSTITSTTCFILKRQQSGLKPFVSLKAKGTSDLVTAADQKVSGNAQRRLRRYLLFHGTFLLRADLEKIQACLTFPSTVPDYRETRSHLQFCTNLNLNAADIKRAVSKEWKAEPGHIAPDMSAIETLIAQKYQPVSRSHTT